MRPTLRFDVQEASGVGDARRGSVQLARTLSFDEVRQGEVAIIVTELATNLVKHAGGGEILVRAGEEDGAVRVEVLALDRGSGIEQPTTVLRDGYSTAGTPGTGLGAVQRLASRFDLYSVPGAGTAVLATIDAQPEGRRFDAARTSAFDIGLVMIPHPGETLSGDAAAVRRDRATVMVTDGLGHGVGAHDAARAAVTAFGQTAAAAPIDILTAVHHGMRGTRGGVAGVACIVPAERTVEFSGMGNISAVVVTPEGRRGLVSQNGTLGLTAPKPQTYTLPWGPQNVLVLHSDGLSTNWNLERYPGLLRRPATLIAGVLYRDFARGRDDTTVLVVREVTA